MPRKCPECDRKLKEIEEDVFACQCGYVSDEDYDPTIDLYPNEEDAEERYEKMQRDAEKWLDRNS